MTPRNPWKRPSTKWDWYFNAKRSNLVRFVVLLIIVWALALVANAQEAVPKGLQDLIKGHAVIYNGTCNVDKNNDLTDKPAKVAGEINCVITIKETDPDHHYVILGHEKAERLVKVNPETMKQTLLWGKKHPFKPLKQGPSV